MKQSITDSHKLCDPLSILTLISLYLAANGWVDRIKDSTARAVNPPQASQIRESKGSVRESPVFVIRKLETGAPLITLCPV
jgi:hypothetical protein